MTPEHQRLEEARLGLAPWRRWGPYVSERQWGTVREDYSADGDAWAYLPHDHARSRAYRWGEDGIAGFCDDRLLLCLTVSLWNTRDPILKERLFGLTNAEGNHGEDVKECSWFLDATPTHSWMRMLYKYPQRPFPYQELLDANRHRSKLESEFELWDAGVFDDDRYFDVVVEFAKAGADDLLVRYTVHNRGPDAAPIHLIPQLFFRNTWAWEKDAPKPRLSRDDDSGIVIHHELLPELKLFVDAGAGAPALLFCENETNVERLYGESRNGRTFKDGVNDAVIHGRSDVLNARPEGTKVGIHWRATLAPGASLTRRVRLGSPKLRQPFAEFESIFDSRRADADSFYGAVHPAGLDAESRAVQRQAWAGLLWSKQIYLYDVRRWLEGDPTQPSPPESRRKGRNHGWTNVSCHRVHLMPDTWEYPWFAAWDHAFHAVAVASIDPDFAKEQLVLLTRDRYMHPSGELPAYEWSFDDANPPVHAWATWRVFQIDRTLKGGRADLDFLRHVFHRLLLNFTWWVNRKDMDGHNVFEGGFLGLDNIGVFDRSATLPTGGTLQQADATSWMSMYALNMLRIAIELAQHEPIYQDLASKFFEHFLQIAEAMTNFGGTGEGLWDEQDGFYYDRLRFPDGRTMPLRIHSIVGLIPLFAVEVLEPEVLDKLPAFKQRLEWYFRERPELAKLVSRWSVAGRGDVRLFSLLRGHRMKCLLKLMLDETKFLSPHGVRSMSRMLESHPYVFWQGTQSLSVRYEPAEGESDLFGGNSNWRGPIWFPLNYLIVESLLKFHRYYGDDFRIECPVGSGAMKTLEEAAMELASRLRSLFLRGADGRRPVFGDWQKFQVDPHFREYIHFYEYFDGNTGRGCGAMHQTGWTALVANLFGPPPMD
ncbi:MAG: glucosidase [Phycisphaerae bacterium]|nr:glucosidase [Phycisphaerae bacterium]